MAPIKVGGFDWLRLQAPSRNAAPSSRASLRMAKSLRPDTASDGGQLFLELRCGREAVIDVSRRPVRVEYDCGRHGQHMEAPGQRGLDHRVNLADRHTLQAR